MNVQKAYCKSKVYIYTTLVAHHARAYHGFLLIKRLGILLLPLDEMLVHDRGTSVLNFPVLIYANERRGTLRVKCLAQEHNAAPQPGLEPRPLDPESVAHLNHYATVPLAS